MTDLTRIVGLALFFTAGLTLTAPVAADPPPELFTQAKPPFPKDEESAMRKRLEALSAKKSWDKATRLATERLGENWCRPEIALEFRTFAALGLVARNVKKPELAVECAIRSLILANSQIERGMAHFELFLLVDAMQPNEFVAFLEKLVKLAKDHSDPPSKAECSAVLSGLDFAPVSTRDYLSLNLSGDELNVAHRDSVASDLLRMALMENPSKTLMAQYQRRTGHSAAALALENLPSRMAGERLSSLSEAKLRAAAETKKLAAAEKGTKAIFAPSQWESKKVGSWMIHQGYLGFHFDGECGAEEGHHFLIIDMSDGFWLYQAPIAYYSNTCSGYGDEWEPTGLSAVKTPNGDVMTSGGSFMSYVNGTACGASGRTSAYQMMCAKNKAGEPNCLVVSTYARWELGGPRNDQPMVRLNAKGRIDFDLEKYSAQVRALLRPIELKSVNEVYDALPGIEAKVRAWERMSSATVHAVCG